MMILSFSAGSSLLNMGKLFSKIFKKYKRKIKIFEKKNDIKKIDFRVENPLK